MKRFGLPQCPYCEKKVNPLCAWYLRTQGEYICPKCGGVSNIVLDPLVKVLGVAAILIGLVFFLIGMVDQADELPVKYAILIAVPFVLFSIVSAFFVHLKRPVLRKREPARPQGRPAAQGRPVPQGARRQSPAGQTVPQRTPVPRQGGLASHQGSTASRQGRTASPQTGAVYGGRRTASGTSNQVTPQRAVPSASYGNDTSQSGPRTSPAQERSSPPYDGRNG